MATIEAEHLYKLFGRDPETRALPMARQGASKSDILHETGCTLGARDVTFTARDRETFVIMGLSGSGKSTVLRCINRLIEPTAGDVGIDGETITGASTQRLRQVRRERLAMVFQHFGLLPHRSVLDNVAFGLEVQGIPKARRRQRAQEAVELVGLGDYADSRVQQLSGGMQQRVGLARALATDADVMLMDEAFSALDPLIRTQMQDELLALQARLHKTILFITHDLDEALKLGDRVAIMKDGDVVQIGTPEQILLHPADDYVRNFVENVNRTRALTAQSVMESAETAMRMAADDSGEQLNEAIRRMQESDRTRLLLTDAQARPHGFVRIDQALLTAAKGDGHLRDAAETNLTRAAPDTPIANLIAQATQTDAPIAVVDDQDRLVGVITRTALLRAICNDTSHAQTPAEAQEERASAPKKPAA